MPIFKFQGRNNEGQLLAGERTAQSAEGLTEQLFKEGITPFQVTEKVERESIRKKFSKMFESKKIPNNEISLFTRQIYTLNKAGVPISSAIKHLSKTSRSARFSQVLLDVSESLESGKDLAQAMEEYPDIFTPLIVAMVRIGQNTGQLDNAFLRLTQYLEMEGSTIKRVKGAIRYPIFVMTAIVLGIIIINIFVIPAFAKVYAKANIELPKLTTMLISMSNFVLANWVWILSVIGIGVFLLLRYLRTPIGKYKWHKLQFQLPVIGILIKRMTLLRFSETFSIIVNSGIPINEGLNLVAQAINNMYARDEINHMQDAIQRGSSIYQAAMSCGLFTTLELQMLAISEETGELGAMMSEIARYYQREVEYDLKRLTDVMEPILLISIAIMVLLLALAVYMPIWNMVKLVHK
jgi:MSHA biogenesis protein MshG